MLEKILLVDDEPAIHEALKRQLRKRWKELETAGGGQEALDLVRNNGPYAVVMSDMLMPGMNGIALLSKIREIHPDSVRVILTGHADLDSAISAVNDGQIFRFLTKPCPAETLVPVLEAAVGQYRLITAERSLLENTLSGAIKMLTEVLSMVNPTAFSNASRLKEYTEEVAGTLGLADSWQFGVAALLSQVGCITLPTDTLGKLSAGQKLSTEEQAMFEEHPAVAGKLLSNIPRLETVSRMVDGQMKIETGDAVKDGVRGLSTDMQGAQILRTVIAYDRLITTGHLGKKAIEILANSDQSYMDEIVQALKSVKVRSSDMMVRTVGVDDLQVGMYTDEAIRTESDILLVPKGQEISFSMLKRLKNFAHGVGIVEPLRVLVPR